MSSAIDGKMHFPSEEVITTYLEKHPQTKDLSLVEQRIIRAIASAFANSSAVLRNVQTSVMVATYNDDPELERPGSEVIAINRKLIQALLDCANGKKI